MKKESKFEITSRFSPKDVSGRFSHAYTFPQSLQLFLSSCMYKVSLQLKQER